MMPGAFSLSAFLGRLAARQSGHRQHCPSRSADRRASRQQLRAEMLLAALEPRLMFCHDEAVGGMTLDWTDPFNNPAATQATLSAQTAASSSTLVSVSTGVPQLSSNPSATVKIYLDFSGAPASTWGSYNVPQTPAYDQDGDPSTFNSAELASIREIWARVAEKLSPFNVDVTTINPGSFNNKVAQKVVIGGAGAWLGSTAGGVSYIGSFYNSSPNTSYVFSANLSNGYAFYTGEATAHEVGHAFGLQHQGLYDSNGNLTQEYNPGNSQVAPVMGVSYYAQRGLWWDGQSSVSSTYIQDDLSVISSSSNGFGYRSSPYGNSIFTATPLSLSGNTFQASGVIAQVTQHDFFSFSNPASGTVTINLGVAQYGPMLDGTLEVFRADGTLVATADTSSLSETVSLNLAAGNYDVAVLSAGNYGDIGQYTLSGTLPSAQNPQGPAVTVNDPSGLSTTRVLASEIDLAWTDNSSNETGFLIQRSTDNGITWNTLTTTAADATSFADTGLDAGATYVYRVQAVDTADQASSNFTSNLAVTTIPPTPANLALTPYSSTQIQLTWSDVSGETAFEIQRSPDGSTWSTIASVGSGVTSFIDSGLNFGTRYYYRLRALNSSGASAYTASLNTFTYTAAPAALAAVATSSTQISLTWSDVTGESYFAIDRSTDGSSWSPLGTSGSGVTAYVDSTAAPGVHYFYRVRAINAAGSSAASNTADAITLPADPANLTASPTSPSKITLTWSPAAGATGYTIERSIDGSTGWSLVGTVSGTATSFLDTGLAVQAPYYYRVRATGLAGSSANYSPVSSATTDAVPTSVPAPSNLYAGRISATAILLSWSDNSSDEDGFIVQRSDNNGGTWNDLTTTAPNATSFEDATVSSGSSYLYRVVAVSASVQSDPSAELAVIAIPAAPANLVATPTGTSSATLAWSDVTGATGFQLERALAGSDTWSVLATTGTGVTTFADTGLLAGTSYVYRVRALNSSGLSDPSTTSTALTLPAAPSGLVIKATGQGRLTLTWSPTSGAASYEIDRSSDGLTWAPLTTTGSTSFVDTGLAPATAYSYRLRAVNSSGLSDNSAPATATTYLAAPNSPSNLTLAPWSANTVILSWQDNSATEAGFRLEYSTNGKSWRLAGTLRSDVSACRVTGLARGVKYFFRVSAYNAMGVSSPSNVASGRTTLFSRVASALAAADTTPDPSTLTVIDLRRSAATWTGLTRDQAPDAPSSLLATPLSASSVQLSWQDNSDNELGFRVEYSLNGHNWSVAGFVAADQNGCLVTGLQRGRTYSFRVSAYNLAGVSSLSQRVSTRTPLPGKVASLQQSNNLLPGPLPILNLLHVKNFWLGLPQGQPLR